MTEFPEDVIEATKESAAAVGAHLKQLEKG